MKQAIIFHNKLDGDIMHIGLYLLIFISKVLENALATLRLILVANGKKMVGAVLAGIIALVWVITTGFVVVNVLEDPFKIIFFALGSFVGSYVGSMIEEKMALGNNMLMVITSCQFEKAITNEIRRQGFAVTVTKGTGMEQDCSILLIMVPRKRRNKVVKIIKLFDKEAMIISEVARSINGGYQAPSNQK